MQNENRNSIFQMMQDELDKSSHANFHLGRMLHHVTGEEQYFCFTVVANTDIGYSEKCIEDAILNYFEINKDVLKVDK